MDFHYKFQLQTLFGNSRISEQQIDEVINLVLTHNVLLSSEEKLEEMINLLIESGDSTLESNATGVTPISSSNMEYLLNLFPDICPSFLNNFCQTHGNSDFDDIVDKLSQTEYKKIEKDPLDIWEHLKQMLPNADPIYLRNQARVLVNRPPGELEAFIDEITNKNNYPTMQEYLINREIQADIDFYLKNFSVSAYLNLVPDPLNFFSNPNRKLLLNEESASEEDIQFALTFLYNHFSLQRKKEIVKIFTHFDRDLVRVCSTLRSLPKAFRHPRHVIDYPDCKNIDLLKEISFLKHEKLIRQFLKQKDEKYRKALEEATEFGLLQTCSCCFDEQLIPEECYFCRKGCIFCKNCVKRGAEVVIGKEETVFPCLAHCDSEFDYSTLKMVLDPKIFQTICHRKQLEEIKAANIVGLEQCPFCDFCMIPNETDKIFKCENNKCMAETCRLCRHKSHIPLRCNEIEYDEDVKMRTFIENKMTEALLRKCWKCSKQFYKESGCNKMTCTCGARMCYVCGAAVNDYSHFNRNNCPLYTENLQEFHLNRVLQGAKLAKEELGITNDPTKLKFDPSKGIERDIN